MGFRGVRMGTPLRVAGAHHARRADCVADLGAHAACLRRGARARRQLMRTPLGRFVLKVLAWLPAAFVVWYFGAPLLLWPVKILLELAVRAGFSDLVATIEQNAAVFTFVTTLKPGAAQSATGRISVDVDG